MLNFLKTDFFLTIRNFWHSVTPENIFSEVSFSAKWFFAKCHAPSSMGQGVILLTTYSYAKTKGNTLVHMECTKKCTNHYQTLQVKCTLSCDC